MCGIFGLWQRDGETIDIPALVRATTALRHRGPDDEGYLLADTRSGRVVHAGGVDTIASLNLPRVEQFAGQRFDLAFGFRRLAILDPSPVGHQPMTGADGRHHLMLNGEIYNYVELREELRAVGAAFRSQSDSEVLLAAYRKWGAGALDRLVGMFAFTVFDATEPSLFLARDPFGIKPLVYVEDDRRFAFASQAGALLTLPGVGRQVNPQRMFEYLRFGVTDHGAETLLADIRQLPAGHHMLVSADRRKSIPPAPYWRIDNPCPIDIGHEDAASRLREMFLENIRLHLRSDVPLGAALSGGIDSSAIIAAMRHVSPKIDLHVFTYCADEASVAEERWADVAATAAGATIHKVRLQPDDLTAELTSLIRAQDEPFGSTSIFAQNRVFQLARQKGITVMLDGQGADELLAGYRPYLSARVASLVRQGRWLDARRLIRSAGALPGTSRRELVQQAAGLLLPDAAQGLARRMLGKEAVPSWLRGEWFAERAVNFKLLWRSESRDVLREKLLEAVTRNSLPMLLRYEDRNSMAHSVESRVPFLTRSMAEFVLSLPEEILISPQAESKSVFRRAMRGIVPDAILDRRDKIGFATPERDWLIRLRPWVDEILGGSVARSIPFLRPDEMIRIWERVLRGEELFDFRVWRWINLIIWSEQIGATF